MSSVDNRRIAKNALMLYLRMILILGISLYTSRVVLSILGVVDFGVYNVVAGIVSMLGALSGSLSGATSRFLTTEIGKGGSDLERVFRCSATVHYILVIIIVIIGETIGLWFVMYKLVIPLDRLNAAFWIFQFAIFSVAVRIIATPYNALIIAFEKMSAFAYISLMEVSLQLGLICCLKYVSGDKLIYYGLLLAIIQVTIRIIYGIYCKKNLPHANGKWLWDKNLSRSILGFAGWTLIGYGAVVGYTQGINILLNLFYGPIANAARGFSNQIQAGVTQLSSNFQMALRPPIIKSYSKNDFESMHYLMIAHAKYSFFLVMVIVVPLIINTPYILHLWLNEVPDYTIDFTRLTLIGTLYCTLNGHTIVAIHATGDIKKFQIIEGLLLILTIPIAYTLLKWYGLSANGIIIVYLAIEFMTQFARVWIVYPKIRLSIIAYIKQVCFPLLITLIPVVLYTVLAMKYYYSCSFPKLCINVLISVIFVSLCIWLCGLNNNERRSINNNISSFIRKNHI